jgi:hypothetical protein
MTKMALKILVALCLPLALLTAVALPAGAASKIGPNQYFTGVINGMDGNTITPIPIQMACFGPLTPGETGHPLAGQALAVHQLFPPTVTGSLGKTGNDSTIDVFFGAPPPAPFRGANTKSKTTTVSFSHYDRTKAIPTSLRLPCGGTGTVWFVPVPVVPPSQAQAVPVQFESQP